MSMNNELESLKQENARLQAEIARLSDPFLHAPNWAEWFAVDEKGRADWYRNEPYTIIHEWEIRDGLVLFAGYYPELAANWKNTKVRRTRKPDSGSLPNN